MELAWRQHMGSMMMHIVCDGRLCALSNTIGLEPASIERRVRGMMYV
jgi:hypothetical protein